MQLKYAVCATYVAIDIVYMLQIFMKLNWNIQNIQKDKTRKVISFKPLNKISKKLYCKYKFKYKLMLLFEIKKKDYVNYVKLIFHCLYLCLEKQRIV